MSNNTVSLPDVEWRTTGKWEYQPTKCLVGLDVKRVLVSEETACFIGDAEAVALTVDGECCSTSFWYDVIGADKLIQGGPIVLAEWIDGDRAGTEWGEVQSYGLRLVTVGPFGEWTTALSFRNESNGYYDGWAKPGAPRSTSGYVEVEENCLSIPDAVGNTDHYSPGSLKSMGG